MSTRRVAVLFWVLAITTVAALGAWMAGGNIVSPAEAAARTAPPTASPILVPVEERVLSSEVVTRGTARFGLPQPIAVPPSTLKANTSGLITTLPVVNKQFNEGDVLLTTSGRPVFVLQGATPAYRDIVPGSSGPDVRQLQEALKRMGFDPGTIDGTYSEKTSEAVKAWYEKAGVEPFGPTPEQQLNLQTLTVAAGDAKKAQLAASKASANADLAVKAAKAKATQAYKTASADVAVKISDRALLALDPRALQTAVAAADANLELARAAVRAAELDGEVLYRTAQDAKAVADFDAILTAERVAQTTEQLEAAKKKIGFQVPLDEIVFLPALPVRVDQVTGVVGSAASGPVLAVTDNQTMIDSSLPLESAPLVKPGMEVVIDEPIMGINTKGVVERVAETPGTNGADGYHIYFLVRVGEAPQPMQGFSLRLTIPIKSTEGAVTTVPLSAVSLGADGASRIQIQRNGKLEYMPVTPGMAADGFVEVQPINGDLAAGQLVVVGNAEEVRP
jgi:peptidoglycan hydrolase-like protein with peptidoglycan-binding domain